MIPLYLDHLEEAGADSERDPEEKLVTLGGHVQKLS